MTVSTGWEAGVWKRKEGWACLRWSKTIGGVGGATREPYNSRVVEKDSRVVGKGAQLLSRVVEMALEHKGASAVHPTHSFTLALENRNVEQPIGLDIARTAAGNWIMLVDVKDKSPFKSFQFLKPGAKLITIQIQDKVHHRPTVLQAVKLLKQAHGDIKLTFVPIVDRFGFVISFRDAKRRPLRDDMIRENEELRKWQKRVHSARAWREYSTRKPGKLRNRIRSGMPDAVRGFVWKAMAATRGPENFRVEGRYTQLLLNVQRFSADGGSKISEAFVQIDKDVPRTMPAHVFYCADDSRGKECLTRVLRAYVAYRPTLGYTQGMSTFAAILLLYMSEEDAFWCFAHLMEHCGLLGLFSEGFPLLFQYLDHWQRLLRLRLPTLYAHLNKQLALFLGLDPNFNYSRLAANEDPTRYIVPQLYVTQWLQTMFIGGSNPAPSSLGPRLMDCILLDGSVGVVFAVGLALLRENRSTLLKQKSEKLADTLRDISMTINVDHIMSIAVHEDVLAKSISKAAPLDEATSDDDDASTIDESTVNE